MQTIWKPEANRISISRRKELVRNPLKQFYLSLKVTFRNPNKGGGVSKSHFALKKIRTLVLILIKLFYKISPSNTSFLSFLTLQVIFLAFT